MVRVSSNLNHQLPQRSFQLGSSRTMSAQRVSAQIALTTKDGDEVRLIAHQSTRTTQTLYNARGQIEGGNASAQLSQTRSQTQAGVSIQVEGDLSEEELQDIQKVIDSLDDLGTHMLLQDSEGLAEQLQALGELDTLANLDLSLDLRSKRSQEVQVASIERGPSKLKRRRAGRRLAKLMKAAKKNPKKMEKLKKRFPRLMERLLAPKPTKATEVTDPLEVVPVPKIEAPAPSEVSEATPPEEPPPPSKTVEEPSAPLRFQAIAQRQLRESYAMELGVQGPEGRSLQVAATSSKTVQQSFQLLLS